MVQMNKILDEELSQSKARVAISEVSLFVFLMVGKFRHQIHRTTITDSLLTIVSYLAFSIAWYYLVKKFPRRWEWRRYFSLFADLAIMTAFFHLGGKNSSIVYPVFLWIIIGNGIRFGERHLVTGIFLGTAGFTSILFLAPFWRDNPELSSGLLAGVIILPIFFFNTLKRLRAVTQLEIQLAKSRLADKAKDQFLATMSHELRTPMNGVLGMAETLRDSHLDSQQREQLHVITSSVESLLRIINDILDYSQISAQTLVLDSSPLDLKQVLSDVRLLMESAAEEKGLQLLFEFPDHQPHHFKGDAIRIRQLAFNLIGNAIKFTEKGHVKLTCRVHQEQGRSLVELEVSDTGIGIPETSQAAIFGHFEQVDGTNTRKYDGAGLGLSISQKLCRMMDGDVTVVSRLGVGSSFTASMRLTPCPEPEAKAPTPPEDLPQFGYRALVVEDNKFNQVVVTNLLKKIGITCVVAENGRQALEEIDAESFDLVFMDIRMPIMNGYEATEHIRARADDRASIPILALTGEATKSDVSKCLAVGMNLHLSKPVRLAVLVDSIQNLEIAAPANC